MDGKSKCKILRALRTDFAKKNGIPYVPNECHNEAECSGTCALCEQEANDILTALKTKIALGEEMISVDTSKYFDSQIVSVENDWSIQVMPIYVLIDISKKASSNLDRCQKHVVAFIKEILDDPYFLESTFVKVFAFGRNCRELFCPQSCDDILWEDIIKSLSVTNEECNLGNALTCLANDIKYIFRKSTATKRGNRSPQIIIYTDGNNDDHLEDGIDSLKNTGKSDVHVMSDSFNQNNALLLKYASEICGFDIFPSIKIVTPGQILPATMVMDRNVEDVPPPPENVFII